MSTVNIGYFVTEATVIRHRDLSDPGRPSATISIGDALTDDGQLRIFVSDPTECDRIIAAVRDARAALVAAVTAGLHTGQLV